MNRRYFLKSGGLALASVGLFGSAPSFLKRVVEAQGELGSFRTLQKQPAWQGRDHHEQLRRFMGSGGRRKTRYARLLVEALEPPAVPRPLDRLLAHI